jgi:hypothetical protein
VYENENGSQKHDSAALPKQITQPNADSQLLHLPSSSSSHVSSQLGKGHKNKNKSEENVVPKLHNSP